MPLVQVPTSLLAQVDASIGGKVAINHPHGKESDRRVLSTAAGADRSGAADDPARAQYIEGLAEAIKHGVALDAGYFSGAGAERERCYAVSQCTTTAIVARRDQSGGCRRGMSARGARRAHIVLNYGHTLGHALEAVAGYRPWLHGEAVAVGMCVAARIGARLGVTPSDVVERQEKLLTYLGCQPVWRVSPRQCVTARGAVG